MTLRLPQIRDFDKLRRFLQLIDAGHEHSQTIGEMMGAGSKYAARHADYYREAAHILGLIEARRSTLTAPGRGLLATTLESDEERELLRAAVASADALGDLRQALLDEREPDLDALVEYALAQVTLSRHTVVRRVKDTLSWRQRLGTAAPARPRRHEVDGPDALGQLELLDRGPVIEPGEWPDPALLPYNWPVDRIHVEGRVYQDMHASEEVLIIAGYASLAHLCDFVASLEADLPRKIRVVFGTEPFIASERPARSRLETLSQELRDYWLEQGISIMHAMSVLITIDALSEGRLETRISRRARRQHAKMYIGQHAAIIGSSNFTEPGLCSQLEANVRVTDARPTRAHFEQARRLGEIYWKLAAPFDDQLLELLRELLRKVTWREALARACAELLEGEWARVHLRDEFGYHQRLWPSQVQGIGQALYVLMEVGSVLIADATGSGKTKAGAWLLRALRERLVMMGRPISDPVLVTPPAVTESWSAELHEAEVRVESHSHGALSSRRAAAHARVVADVEVARILAIDEAHNFINSSNRAQIVNGNLADHVLLFTATPINRAVSDLLGIADLLGADNLDDETLKILEEVGWRKRRVLSEDDKQRLRGALRRFTVRRTKRAFNELIDREPGRYLNRQGDACRYPDHEPHYYELGESREDCTIAAQISELARSLRGVIMFDKPIRLSRIMRELGWTEEKYASMRLASARALARYQVRSALRSSRAALWEHLHGTAAAKQIYGVERLDKGESGDVIAKVAQLRKRGPPASDLGEALPPWLRDPEEFERICGEELARYERIAELCTELSSGRERAKAAQIRELVERHGLVIAFDERPITLAVMRNLLENEDFDTFVATGGRRAEQRAVVEAFGLGATTGAAVALCSNSMAEGINLQQASAVIHLDMPSVVRIAEQRVGRIDRMDSPHGQVESWWPRDAEPFALSSDEKLGARLELVGELLGSNVELPNADEHRTVGPEEVVHEMAAHERQQLELLDDAFASVRSLVEGPSALVDARTYRAMRQSQASVLAAVAVVRAQAPWGFFTIPGTARSAPRWVLIDGTTGQVWTALDEVAAQLRERIDGVEDLELDQRAVEVMQGLLAKLQARAPSLLPRRKQRALEQMQKVLRGYVKQANKDRDLERLAVVQQLQRMSGLDDRIDFDQLVESWLSLVRPRWRAALRKTPGRRSLRRLHGLNRELLDEPLSTAELEGLVASIRIAKPLAERVVAAIVGVP
ncbi:MAG: helicase-related protein [Enhygromyxa sp.]